MSVNDNFISNTCSRWLKVRFSPFIRQEVARYDEEKTFHLTGMRVVAFCQLNYVFV